MHSERSFEQKPLNYMTEKGVWAYPGTAQILGSVAVSRDGPNFFEYPLLSQECVKLRTSNLAGIFTGSIRGKAPLKYGRKGAPMRNINFQEDHFA